MPLLDSTGSPNTVYSTLLQASRNWRLPNCNEIVGGAAAAADAPEADGGDASADAAEADPPRGLLVAPGERFHSAPTDPRGDKCTVCDAAAAFAAASIAWKRRRPCACGGAFEAPSSHRCLTVASPSFHR